MRQTTSFFLASQPPCFSPPYPRAGSGCVAQQAERQGPTYKAYEIAYTSTLVDLKNDFELTQDGTVQIEGDRFHLNLGDYIHSTATAKRCGRLSPR